MVWILSIVLGPSGRITHVIRYIAYIGLFGTGKCRFIQVLYLGRAPRTKETLPDFREKCRVTRHSRVFRGLTGSQRTPGFWGVTAWYQSLGIRIPRELGFGYPSPQGGMVWSIGLWEPMDRKFGLGPWKCKKKKTSPLGVV